MMSAYEQRTPLLLLRTTSATRSPRSYGITSVHLGHTQLSEPTIQDESGSQESSCGHSQGRPGALSGTGINPGNTPYWYNVYWQNDPEMHIMCTFHSFNMACVTFARSTSCGGPDRPGMRGQVCTRRRHMPAGQGLQASRGARWAPRPRARTSAAPRRLHRHRRPLSDNAHGLNKCRHIEPHRKQLSESCCSEYGAYVCANADRHAHSMQTSK